MPEVRVRYPDATYVRRISLVPSPFAIDAAMEDYVHHFSIRLTHGDGVVIDAVADGRRIPWVTCAVGAQGVRSIIGTPLVDVATLDQWAPDRSAQCVHVLDLAVLAARHADDARPTRYEIRIPHASQTRRRAELRRNGEPVMAWQLDGEHIVGPAPFTGVALSRGEFFAAIRAAEHDSDALEAAVVLRRACSIGRSRGMVLDDYTTAAAVRPPDNSCFTYRHDVAHRATRVIGSTRATELDTP